MADYTENKNGVYNNSVIKTGASINIGTISGSNNVTDELDSDSVSVEGNGNSLLEATILTVGSTTTPAFDVGSSDNTINVTSNDLGSVSGDYNYVELGAIITIAEDLGTNNVINIIDKDTPYVAGNFNYVLANPTIDIDPSVTLTLNDRDVAIITGNHNYLHIGTSGPSAEDKQDTVTVTGDFNTIVGDSDATKGAVTLGRGDGNVIALEGTNQQVNLDSSIYSTDKNFIRAGNAGKVYLDYPLATVTNGNADFTGVPSIFFTDHFDGVMVHTFTDAQGNFDSTHVDGDSTLYDYTAQPIDYSTLKVTGINY